MQLKNPDFQLRIKQIKGSYNQEYETRSSHSEYIGVCFKFCPRNVISIEELTYHVTESNVTTEWILQEH